VASTTAGYEGDGEPGRRLDPDGNNVEAVFHGSATAGDAA